MAGSSAAAPVRVIVPILDGTDEGGESPAAGEQQSTASASQPGAHPWVGRDNSDRVLRVTAENLNRLLGLAAQSLVDNGDFHTTWDGIWWAVETVTTVGYGDLQPTSVQGRIVAMVVMLFGIGFLSVLTATIASWFVKTERSDETAVLLTALMRIEADLAELKEQVADSRQ